VLSRLSHRYDQWVYPLIFGILLQVAALAGAQPDQNMTVDTNMDVAIPFPVQRADPTANPAQAARLTIPVPPIRPSKRDSSDDLAAQLSIIHQRQQTPQIDPQCPARLTSYGLVFQSLPNQVRGDCVLQGVIDLDQFQDIALSPNAELTCTMAERTLHWITYGVRPAAERWFGQPVAKLYHYGAYSCRRRSGGKISEHGFANALDIAVFELADGTRVRVKDHWHSDGTAFGRRAAGFLRDVGSAACQSFMVVLTPESDAAHHDHFHFDAGYWKSCG